MAAEAQWLNPPLGVAVEHYLASVDWARRPYQAGIRHLIGISSSTVKWARALANWSLCCLLLFDDQQEPTFRESLSMTQFNCVRILLEWWMAECQDRHLTTAAIDFITARAAGISDNLDAQTSTRILESSYHTHLFQLFEKEFCSPPTKPASSSVYPSDLPRRRNDAAVCASNQRIGNKCYNARQLFSAHSQLPPDQHPPNDQLNKSSDDESAGEDLPTSFVEKNEASNEPMQRFTQALQWPRRLAEALFAHPPLVPLGATLEPCPWLKATEKGSFLPHFLWDVSKRETVKVSPLKEVPEYTAVSHTWGRWRLRPPPGSPPGSPPPPPLPVDNVPWPVPQNSLFNVQDLPEILSTVPGGSPFVWFDLVCIPQVPREDTKSELAKLKRQEVARQASIFSRAKHSVVWFSDVVSFQALQIAVYWMSLYLLEHPQHNGLDVDATFAAANDAAGRLPQPPTSHILTFDSSVRRGWKEHGWLSSLWTLQEACLRPDMWICDKGFHVLNANGISPLSLDELLALAKGCSGRFVAGGTKIVERQPGPANFQAAFEAIICLGQTGMTGLNNVSPLSILWLGDQRKCTDRSRAPATMSAIGTTDWYGPDDGRSDRPESPLILGRYPPEFVREVRQKFKAIFFALRLLNNQNPTTTLPIDLTPVGSMLPFGDRPAMMKVDTVFELTLGFVPQHPSVETWEVQNNGTVHVREAGIMASSTVQGDALEDLEVFIYALDPNTVTPTEKAQGHGIGKISVRLHEWVRTRSYVCFAVWLFHEDQDERGSQRNVFGLLFRQIKDRFYLKIGDFQSKARPIESIPLPASQEVEWVVL